MRKRTRQSHSGIRGSLLLTAVLLFVCLSICFTGCGGEERHIYSSWEELNDAGATVGVMTGAIAGPLVEEQLPNTEVQYFNGTTDVLTALQAGKVDAMADDDTTFRYMQKRKGGFEILDGVLMPTDYGAIFAKDKKGEELCKEYSAFIEQCGKDGTLKQIDQNWLTPEGEAKMAVDYTSLPAPNGTLTVGTEAQLPPFTYIEENVVVGYELDLLSRFCQEKGYGMQVMDMNFDGLIPAVVSGKVDIATSCITITEERAESVNFSPPYYKGGCVIAVYDENAAGGGFFDKLKDSFVKTFVKEDRYKLFLIGIKNTLLITILSILIGTLLGFLVFMACRHNNRIACGLTGVGVWILKGMPIVVLLMILYYIVFASSPLGGVFVAVVAFSLTFGTSVYGMLQSGTGAIDKGQTEAAYALGFSDHKTFFKIILPQAAVHFMPSYKAEIISLIKATAVVGYIAVQDLTKMGDVVRSRTYDAFFPLIAVAIIYFILAGILIFIVKRIEIRFDPRQRSRETILKGVKTND